MYRHCIDDIRVKYKINYNNSSNINYKLKFILPTPQPQKKKSTSRAGYHHDYMTSDSVSLLLWCVVPTWRARPIFHQWVFPVCIHGKHTRTTAFAPYTYIENVFDMRSYWRDTSYHRPRQSFAVLAGERGSFRSTFRV